MLIPWRALAGTAVGGWSRHGDVLRFDCLYYNAAADLRTPFQAQATVEKPDSILAGIGGSPYRFSLQDLRTALEAADGGRAAIRQATEPRGIDPFKIDVTRSTASFEFPGGAIELPLARARAVLESAAR